MTDRDGPVADLERCVGILTALHAIKEIALLRSGAGTQMNLLRSNHRIEDFVRTGQDRSIELTLDPAVDALKPDFAFVYAYKGDGMGNLVFRKTARNYNPEMAKAARISIAAVENLVEPGKIDPDMVHLSGIYVQRVVKVERPSNYYPTID